MNKFIITILCFTLIFECISGCTDTHSKSIPTDPVIGSWKTNQNGSGDIVFFENGTFIYNNSKIVEKYPNSKGTWVKDWVKEDDTYYSVSLPNITQRPYIFTYRPKSKTLQNLVPDLGVYNKIIPVSNKIPKRISIFPNPIIGTWTTNQTSPGDITFFENGMVIYKNKGGIWGKINETRYFLTIPNRNTAYLSYNPQTDTLTNWDMVEYKRAAFNLSNPTSLIYIFTNDPQLNTSTNSKLIANRVLSVSTKYLRQIPNQTNPIIGNWKSDDKEYENITFFDNGSATYGSSGATWRKTDDLYFLNVLTASHLGFYFEYNPESDTLMNGDISVYFRN